jgi:hypothetical protein
VRLPDPASLEVGPNGAALSPLLYSASSEESRRGLQDFGSPLSPPQWRWSPRDAWLALGLISLCPDHCQIIATLPGRAGVSGGCRVMGRLH